MTPLPSTNAVEEAISPRWKPDQIKDMHIQWAGVARDATLLAEVSNEDPKVLKAAQRFFQKEDTTGWDFRSYAIESQRRKVQAVKFHVYEKKELEPGSRATLQGLKNENFLNGAAVRVVEYNPLTEKYIVRPTVPLEEEKKLSSTGKLSVHARHVVGPENELRVWTFGCIYAASPGMSQYEACYFVQKIILLSEPFRRTDAWLKGGIMSCMDEFGPILESQMEWFQDPVALASLEDGLEYCELMIKENVQHKSVGVV